MSQIAYQTRHSPPTLYRVLRLLKDRKCRKLIRSGRPCLLSEKDARKLGSVVEANRRHLLHDICAKFNALRPQTVSKRKIQRQICEENFHKWSKKNPNSCKEREKGT